MNRKDDIDMLRDEVEEEEEEYPEPEIFRHGDKYLYDYQWYHQAYPEEWAVFHKEGSGPGECGNCAEYASMNGVCIGYCANCATLYDGTRGRGFISIGVENNDADSILYPSAFDTYLKGVDIHSIQGIEQELMVIDDEEEEELMVMDDEEEEEELMEIENEDGDNPYEDNQDVSVFNCHFEGGYNDM